MGRAVDPALAATLRAMREDRRLTREALAFKAGITVGALARIELAQANPAWDTVRRITQALGVTMVQLAGAVDNKPLPGQADAH
jgi:transcriptional regulator with XRE-family HTH domain